MIRVVLWIVVIQIAAMVQEAFVRQMMNIVVMWITMVMFYKNILIKGLAQIFCFSILRSQ
jgi:hypothetical protein